MIKDEKLKQIAKIAVPILKKNGVVKAGIFGSYARGEAKKSSDIDLLIQFKGKKSLFDLIGLEQELIEHLGKKVDLVTYKGLSPYLKDYILKDEIKIL
ncbi:MAG: nucleotidyltransferase family protein [Nanoarchaeota archaeon]|nr:nucleotidyltransferase family protein [Nanoarchaeota archaeon]MBU1644046.1 nucleotidyltransferase family protein [Nanoarchaeota archaeon]MBU1977288.1 nucleotidyltransferase family protein [Nanoarchaeota archaeon]